MTSRRFCEVCEIEFKGNELLPKFGAAFLLLFGIFGAGSFLTRGEKPLEIRTSPMVSTERREPEIQKAAASNQAVITPANTVGSSMPAAALISKTPVPPAYISPKTVLKPSGSEAAAGEETPTYFCGAATKKGTPCSRRVKIAGKRCWQHDGQPAMLPPDKLIVSRRN